MDNTESIFLKELSQQFSGDKIKLVPVGMQLRKILFPEAKKTVYNIVIGRIISNSFVTQEQIDEYEENSEVMSKDIIKEITKEINDNLFNDFFLFVGS